MAHATRVEDMPIEEFSLIAHMRGWVHDNGQCRICLDMAVESHVRAELRAVRADLQRMTTLYTRERRAYESVISG